MDGAQDMGGVDGFGPVLPEADEPLFHADWERRAFGMTLAMGVAGGWNIDMSRFAREDRAREDYLGKSYYQLWLAGLERLMAERDLVATEEIEAGRVLHAPKAVPVLQAERVGAVLRRGGPSQRAVTEPALFAVGDHVRAKVISPVTHTRLPRYVRGHVGIVERLHGAHVFPDSNAIGRGENPQWLYTVVFDGRELWGHDGDASVKTSVEAWQSYLDPA